MTPILRLKHIGQVIEDQPRCLVSYDEIHILAIYPRGTKVGCLCRLVDKDGSTIADMPYDDIMTDVENCWFVETI